jgi:hypothetical protein
MKEHYTPHPISARKAQPSPSYIDTDVFKKSLQGYDNNPLIQYLDRIVGDEATPKTIERYYIGTSKTGGTVFWQIDGCGKVHTGKIIQYAPDGHRRKDVTPPVQWVHSLLMLQGYNLSQCLFGEHLLSDTTKLVAIVESEKTAIIASCYLPEFIWLACGGSEGLNLDKCRCLKGRRVVLYPDAGMYDKWSFKAEQMRQICESVSISSLIEEHATDRERQTGFDLADYLVRFSPSGFVEWNPSEETTSKVTPLAQSKQYTAFVSDAGTLYIPTPPDCQTTYTVYPSVEVYNRRSELPTFVPMQDVDMSGMNQVFINLDTLTL